MRPVLWGLLERKPTPNRKTCHCELTVTSVKCSGLLAASTAKK